MMGTLMLALSYVVYREATVSDGYFVSGNGGRQPVSFFPIYRMFHYEVGISSFSLIAGM